MSPISWPLPGSPCFVTRVSPSTNTVISSLNWKRPSSDSMVAPSTAKPVSTAGNHAALEHILVTPGYAAAGKHLGCEILTWFIRHFAERDYRHQAVESRQHLQPPLLGVGNTVDLEYRFTVGDHRDRPSRRRTRNVCAGSRRGLRVRAARQRASRAADVPCHLRHWYWPAVSDRPLSW